MATSGWTQWSETEARRELRAWDRSGEPLARFAQRRGYSGQRLRRWRDRLADATPSMVPALVPVRVVEREPESPIEVVVGPGRVVHVRRGFDPDTLAAVVRALAGAC